MKIEIINLKTPEKAFLQIKQIIANEPTRQGVAQIALRLLEPVLIAIEPHLNAVNKWELLIVASALQALNESPSGDHEIIAGVFEAIMEQHAVGYKQYCENEKQKRHE